MSDIDLTAPEVQAAITAAIDKATAPLLAKRDELLGEVKKLRKNTEIDPAELEKVEAERDSLKTALSEANKAAKTAGKLAEDATKRAEAAEGSSKQLLIDNAMSEALAKANVTDPVYRKAAQAMFRGQAEVGKDNAVLVGDKSLADFFAEWAGGDEGKRFVAAPDMSGSGAQQSGKPAPSGSKHGMSPGAKAEFIGKHGADAYANLQD